MFLYRHRYFRVQLMSSPMIIIKFLHFQCLHHLSFSLLILFPSLNQFDEFYPLLKFREVFV